jgi:hypothetical protein
MRCCSDKGRHIIETATARDEDIEAISGAHANPLDEAEFKGGDDDDKVDAEVELNASRYPCSMGAAVTGFCNKVCCC